STQTGFAGLGLAISREIVQAHGGTITATSSNEKTIFTVMIPGNS
ncbi:ATP-binding protein, partial [Lysinibacillus sp. D4B1_S16]